MKKVEILVVDSTIDILFALTLKLNFRVSLPEMALNKVSQLCLKGSSLLTH